MHVFTIEADEDFAKIARILIDLADDKRHVKTSTDYPRLALIVPDYIFDRFQQYLEFAAPVEPAKSRRK